MEFCSRRNVSYWRNAAKAAVGSKQTNELFRANVKLSFQVKWRLDLEIK
jgi:hypothetical protein